MAIPTPPPTEPTMSHTTVKAIAERLNSLLEIDKYADLALNGLQIESPILEVRKVALAVDAGLSIVEQAADQHCQMLIVHHGVLWGQCAAIVGPWARKLQACMTRGISIYAAHLPLDGHMELGNAAQLAQELGLENIAPEFPYKGATIGVRGQLTTPRSAQEVASQLCKFEGALQPPLVLPFGPPIIKTVGIATGAASTLSPECAASGIDLLITGEPKQEAYHLAKEYQCSVICMGHYASETFGVRALERVLHREFRVETCWISEPTGI
jgi:dinuclear metal center YbgI/SA1388 family protein